jgi:hypothetical protein
MADLFRNRFGFWSGQFAASPVVWAEMASFKGGLNVTVQQGAAAAEEI